MARFDDGVYLEWSKYGDKECDQPRSIVVIENEFMVIHVTHWIQLLFAFRTGIPLEQSGSSLSALILVKNILMIAMSY